MASHRSAPKIRHVAIVAASVALACAILRPAAATVLAATAVVGCVVVLLRRAPIGELIVLLAILFALLWWLWPAVEASKAS